MSIKSKIREFIGGEHNQDVKRTSKQAAQVLEETLALSAWEQGTSPNLKVSLVVDQDFGHVHASYGDFASVCLGEDTDVLERLGYRINVWHRRDYLDVPSQTVHRLRPREVKGAIATGAIYVYGPDVKTVQAATFATEPLANGGDTRVRVMAPSGHWAEADAICADDDAFDKSAGRSLALKRALDRLTEVVNG